MGRCPFSWLANLVSDKQKPTNHRDWLERAKAETVVIDLHDPAILKQLEMIQLTVEEVQLAKSIQSLIRQHVAEIVSSFYQTITNVEELREIILANSTLERLQRTLEAHLIEMFSGVIDDSYLLKRIRVANVHYRIGLEPKWYMGAFQNLQNTLLDIVHRHIQNRDVSIRISKVITKILNFEQQIVLEAYEKENIRQRQLQYEKVKEELKEKIVSVCQDMTVITEQTNASVQQLIASSSEVNHSVLHGAETSRYTQTLASDGQRKLAELEHRVSAIFDRTNSMESIVGRLSQSMQEIVHVVSLVQEVAEQTNLLALNSSIEAARAGEHGRGFSVVAEEVRKLSQQTKQSAEQIRTSIVQAKAYSEQVAAAIQDVQASVKESKQESEATEAAFGRILQSMTASLGDVETVETGMKLLVQHIEEIGLATHKVVASAEMLHQAARNV